MPSIPPHCEQCPLFQRRKGVLVVNELHSPSLLTSGVVDELLAAKRKANCVEEYVQSLGMYCRKFAAKHQDFVNISHLQIEDWLAQFEAASSRQTWLNRISTLFSFGVRRGYRKDNPCDRVERVRIDHPVPVTLTVEQAKAMLDECPDSIKPYLALALFAGIRPREIQRMDWADIDLETKTAEVKGKTRCRRIVPLEDAAVRVLSRCAKASGPVAPSKSTLKRWRAVARAMIGGKWTIDVLRHTAASYLLAKVKDIGIVATRLGNSPKILMAHYIRPVTEQKADKFWSL